MINFIDHGLQATTATPGQQATLARRTHTDPALSTP